MTRTVVRPLMALLLALSSLPQPSAAEARPVRIGILSSVNPRSAPFFAVFERRLRELGHVEGENLSLEFRNAEGQFGRLPGLAAELVRLDVDLIVAIGTEATLRAARSASSTTPVVVVAIDYDPVALGYAAGLARPGGTVTGVFFRQVELTAKRLEILKETVPGAARVGVLSDVSSAEQVRAADPAARSLGLRLQTIETGTVPGDLVKAFELARQGRAGALLVPASPVFFKERRRIADLALRSRVPTMCVAREFVEAGGLMAYGANISEMFRRAAAHVDKILKGARPGDLPVEQPTKFELVINLRTAKALGVTIPPSVLMRADEVIR